MPRRRHVARGCEGSGIGIIKFGAGEIGSSRSRLASGDQNLAIQKEGGGVVKAWSNQIARRRECAGI